jgi:hypothetical protein
MRISIEIERCSRVSPLISLVFNHFARCFFMTFDTFVKPTEWTAIANSVKRPLKSRKFSHPRCAPIQRLFGIHQSRDSTLDSIDAFLPDALLEIARGVGAACLRQKHIRPIRGRRYDDDVASLNGELGPGPVRSSPSHRTRSPLATVQSIRPPTDSSQWSFTPLVLMTLVS